MIAGAKNGAEGAWTAIYESNFPPIYRYVRARVFDEAAAADVASSVFLAALSGIGSYTYKGRPLLAWLYRIAHNLVGDYRRKAINEKERNGDRPVEEVHSGNGFHPDGDPAATVGDLDLRAAMQALPDSQRDVLVLRYFVGLTTPEIARVMGKQPTAVYSLQARAVASLRTVLE